MKFTDSHEWILLSEDGHGVVGITRYAQGELGEIVYIELPAVGREVKLGEEIAVLESTKAAADIYSPVSGVIVEINQALGLESEKINVAPETEGWLYKIRLTNLDERDTLLSLDEYLRLTNS